jgi:DNA polymerase III delta subunit
LIERCKNIGLGHIRVIDLSDVPIDSTTALLASSFLGNRSYYWLKNVSELDAKKRSYWLSYVQSYSGPNCLILFCGSSLSAQKNDSIINVEIPDQFDQAASAAVFNSLMSSDSRRCSLVVRTLFKRRRKVSLDAICLLTHYMAVSGLDLELFLNNWLDVIIVPDASLFDLSKYLFARNQEAFFRVWQSMADTYGELFWIAYWSDIFWRAYHFSRLSALGDHEQAKKFAPRLPFSFIQGGWRQVSLDELKGALNYIYILDTDIKNGVQGYSFLELLYLKFFLRHFDKR